MAQFRAVIRGQRGEASRLGSKRSGLEVEANGWLGGVRVEAFHDGARGEGSEANVFKVYATTGSAMQQGRTYVGYVDGCGNWHPAPRSA